MLIKLKALNKFAVIVVLLLSSVATTLLSSPVTRASTAYDNVIHPLSKLELYNNSYTTSCDPIDYSSNWQDAFFGTSSLLSGWGDSTTKSQMISLFNNRTNWGISVQDVSGVSNMAIIWWTDATADTSIDFSMDGSFPRAVVWKTGSGTFAYIGITLDSSCNPTISAKSHTTGIGAYPVAYDPNDAAAFGQTIKIWRQSVPVNYPSGYAGNLVNKPIDGNAICTWGSQEITDIQIETANSQDGGALLSDGGIMGTHYSYYLTDPDDTYQINVLCDGHVALGPTVANTASSSLNWGCAYDSQLHSYLCNAI